MVNFDSNTLSFYTNCLRQRLFSRFRSPVFMYKQDFRAVFFWQADLKF